ncbi:hypothetical protein P22_2090 [Propionispora sp. 2/2-37]|uniref:pyruvate formate-lyase-activating protein n=1 Tax=Propionispora sp. 2/2-37 TaxID=1677858 RepID=UPI0006BB88FC|nr:pyruvate formate-lyase-activating protein [Propionispora sp. 2/2-37]CUH96002.1 hypothetical protein P22_2090 [Propionispora sp. 2/2-37]
MKGYYHSIETFGTVDGPGIRYVLFLSGCRLACRFCHNPDTWQQTDKTITVEEVLSDIERYRSYYLSSDGGLTLSGGEPLLQPDFAASLFKECQNRGFHTLLDTSGYCPQEHIRQVLPYTDMVQFSLKTVDKAKHYLLTAGGNELILDNLRYIASQHTPLVIRYVVIPGLTDSLQDMEDLTGFLHSLPGKPVIELLAYHTLGCEKWQTLGLNYSLPDVSPASDQQVEQFASLLRSRNVTVL